jgi:hypothetical protein
LANEVDDDMFVGIPDAYPVIEGLSHRVSTLVPNTLDDLRARDDTHIVTKQDSEAVAGRARSLSPVMRGDDDGSAAIDFSALRLEASPAEQREFGQAEWSFQLETACEEKEQDDKRVERKSPDGSPFNTPTRHRSPSVGGLGIRRTTSNDALRMGSSHARIRSSDLHPADPSVALARRQSAYVPPRNLRDD